MKRLISTLLAGSLWIAVLYAGYIDTGYITWEQPNSVTFTARLWGDEFFDWMETEDGYRIIRGADKYFYYAVLDSRGEFTASTSKPGIDPPLASSYQLKRSPARIVEIEAEIAAFNNDLDIAYQRYLAKKAAAPNGIITDSLGVILVDFTPSERWRLSPNFPNGYEKAHYDSLIFSRNYWYEPNPTFPFIHPDGHALFGSFSDFYDDQSFDTYRFVGKDGLRQIVNPARIDTAYLPLWVKLPNNKSYYDSLSRRSYLQIAIDSASAQLGPYGFDQAEYNCFAFISAGGFTLRGFASPSRGWYNASEINFPSSVFQHIAEHCHEFGHLLGLPDYNNSSNPDEIATWHWKTMAGNGQGPNPPNGACTAGFSPFARTEHLKWAKYDTIRTDTTLTLVYDYDNPNYYFLESWYNSQHFVLENRLREGFDLYTPIPPGFNPNDPNDLNGNIGGLLIWKNGTHIVPADNDIADSITWVYTWQYASMAGDPFPYNQQDSIYGSGLNFNDDTTPGSRSSSGVPSHIAVNNISWNSNDSTTTVNISFSYGTLLINSDVTWNGTVELHSEVLITNNARLTIDPGTTIVMDTAPGGVPFKIWFMDGAELYAVGQESNEIVFQSSTNQSNSDWQGLFFEEDCNFDIGRLTIKNALKGLDVNAMDSTALANQQYENLAFENCKTAISGMKGDHISFNSLGLTNVQFPLSISGNYQSFNTCAINQSELSVGAPIANITKSTFITGKLSFLGSDTTTLIDQCAFLNNSKLTANGLNALIKNNTFQNGSWMEITVDGVPLIRNNVLNGGGSSNEGIVISGGPNSRPEIVNNTIAYYRMGIYTKLDRELGYGEPEIRNNILFGNELTENDSVSFLGNGTASYNCIYNVDNTGAPLDSTHIFQYPLFVDTLNSDFHLLSNSPCIDRGDPADPFSNEPLPNGGRINMGAYGNTSEAAITFNTIVQSDLTANTTWNGYVNIMEDVATQGYTLTVQPQTKVLFDNDKTLTIDGDFLADSNPNQQNPGPAPIEFRGYRETDQMGGVYITGDGAGTINLRNAHFQQGDIGLYLQEIPLKKRQTSV